MLQFWLHIPRSSWRLLPRRSARHDHIGLATTESGWLNLISTLGFAPSDLAVPNIRAQWQLELRTVPTVEASYGHRALPPKRPSKRIHLFALYCPPQGFTPIVLADPGCRTRRSSARNSSRIFVGRAGFRRRRPHPGGSGQESAVHLSGRGRSAKARRDDFDAGAWAAGRVPAGTRLLVCAKRHALSI